MGQPQLTVFFDGACHLCSREIHHQQKMLHGDDSVAFVDIADPAFDAAGYHLDARAVNKHMHVMDQDGKVHKGVDAFAVLWRRIPGYRWLGFLVRQPVLRQLAKVGYAVFAEIRPYLPKRQREENCETGTCPR